MTLDPSYYNQNSSVQQKLAKDLYQSFDFKSTDQILDIGCGDGTITADIAKNITQGNILGIDQSEEMITFARNKHMNQHVAFEVIDAANKNGLGESLYDVVVSFNCLYWIREVHQALKNIYSSLKTHGKLLALVYPKESEYYQPFIRVLSQPQWANHLSNSCVSSWMYSSAWKDSLFELGFKTIKIQVIQSCSDHTLESYEAYVRGWLACVFPATDKEYEIFLHQLLQDVQTHYLDKNTLKIPYTKLHFLMEK